MRDLGSGFLQAVDAAGGRALRFEEKPLHVRAILPALRVAGGGRMPQMVGACPAEDRSDAYASTPEPHAKFVVFAAPAGVFFVQAVEGFVIAAPDAEGAAV